MEPITILIKFAYLSIWYTFQISKSYPKSLNLCWPDLYQTCIFGTVICRRSNWQNHCKPTILLIKNIIFLSSLTILKKTAVPWSTLWYDIHSQNICHSYYYVRKLLPTTSAIFFSVGMVLWNDVTISMLRLNLCTVLQLSQVGYKLVVHTLPTHTLSHTSWLTRC